MPLGLANGTVLTFDRPLVMGIVNVTPDSFSDGGRFLRPLDAVDYGRRLIEEGADLLDVGGESTRPGAEAVSTETELARILPVVEGLAAHGVPISIDTSKPGVAEAALAAGASIINDVRGARQSMLEVAASTGAPVIAMHMKGTPSTMQSAPQYDDVVREVLLFLRRRLAAAERFGVRLLLDPGIGFGKTLEDNTALLRALPQLVELGAPVVLGTSRKSMFGKLLGLPQGERLEATIATTVHAVLAGVAVVRVHDVLANRRALDVAQALRPQGARPGSWVGMEIGRAGDERSLVEGLELRATVGVPDREREKPQPLLVDVEAVFSPGPEDDVLTGRLDYARIVAAVSEHVAARPWRLLETLARSLGDRVLDLAREAGAPVLSVRVRVEKPEISRQLGARVAVECTRLVGASGTVVPAYVGLGANLGARRETLERAIALLSRLGRLTGRSSFYETEPVGFADQPDFLNAVVRLEVALDARSLLEQLQRIERELGREKTFRNGPRVVDLDLLLFGDQEIDEPGLVVPHPRMGQRAFVLEPLLEIAPEISPEVALAQLRGAALPGDEER